MRNLATTAALPAQEAIAALRSYAHAKWVGSRAWRITSASLGAIVVLTICHMVNISTAMAADGGGGSAAGTFFLDLTGQTDSHGIGVWQYTTLPLDYGQASTPTRMIRGVILRGAWLLYTLGLFAILALVKFILDFTWLEWLLSPVILLTDTIRSIMSQAGIMTLGLSVSALVIAIGFLRGRKAAALVEFCAVVIIFGIASAPAISNPQQLFKGEGSWIQNSRDYGVEAGNLTTSKDGGPGIVGNPISAGIIDQTLRRPTQYIAFGAQLSGDCAAKFDAKMLAGTDAEGVRKEVTGCSEAVKKANETDGWEALGVLFIFFNGTLGIMALAGVFIFFIIKDTTLALLGLVNTVLRAHLAVFPGGGRYAFINALGQMIVNIVMVGLYIWMLSAYLWLVNAITAAIPEAALVMGNIIFGTVVFVMVYTFIKLKKSGKKVADLLAKALGKTGLGKEAPQRQPSNLFKTLKTTGERALGNRLGNGAGRAPVRQPVPRVPAEAGTRPGTRQGPSKGPASLARLALAAGSVAASGGTSLALQAASTVVGSAAAAGETATETQSAGRHSAGMLSGAAQAMSAGAPAAQALVGGAAAAKALTGGTNQEQPAPETPGANTAVQRPSGTLATPSHQAPASAPQEAPSGAGTAPSQGQGAAAHTAPASPAQSAPRQAGPTPAVTPPAPLEGKIVDRVPRDARRLPVYQPSTPDRPTPPAPQRRNAGLVRQQPPSMNGIVHG